MNARHCTLQRWHSTCRPVDTGSCREQAATRRRSSAGLCPGATMSTPGPVPAAWCAERVKGLAHVGPLHAHERGRRQSGLHGESNSANAIGADAPGNGPKRTRIPACDDPVKPLGRRTKATLAAADAISGAWPKAGATAVPALRGCGRPNCARAPSGDARGCTGRR